MKAQSSTPVADLVTAATAGATTFSVDKDHSQVTFQVRHLFSRTRGRFTDFGGTIVMDDRNPSASSVEFRIQAGSIDTDNTQRDEHLRSGDFFDVPNHPEILFRSEKIEKVGPDNFEVAGTLTLRGVSRPIVLPVTYGGSGQDPWGHTKAGFSTGITLNRKDFGMIWNAALDNGGFVLGDEVWVTIELEVLKETALASAK